jgi:Protein of unknown function (DUF551)
MSVPDLDREDIDLLDAASIERRRTYWRPIETAPKDGTEVDLWCINQSALSSSGRATDCHYHCGEWLKYGDSAEVGWFAVHNATHWMPLPAPPV